LPPAVWRLLALLREYWLSQKASAHLGTVALLALAVGLFTHMDWIRFAALVGGICFFFLS